MATRKLSILYRILLLPLALIALFLAAAEVYARASYILQPYITYAATALYVGVIAVWGVWRVWRLEDAPIYWGIFMLVAAVAGVVINAVLSILLGSGPYSLMPGMPLIAAYAVEIFEGVAWWGGFALGIMGVGVLAYSLLLEPVREAEGEEKAEKEEPVKIIIKPLKNE
jgi:hypothetical protein